MRCKTHPAFEADYCPSCGTAREIGATDFSHAAIEDREVVKAVARIRAEFPDRAAFLADPDAHLGFVGAYGFSRSVIARAINVVATEEV